MTASAHDPAATRRGYLAATEREALCRLAAQLGPDAPTLCAGWSVHDLVAHLVLREGSPASVGIAVRPLAALTEREMARLRGKDFGRLLARLRGGPPRWSPLRFTAVDKRVNAMEFFVHHEDIRRAQPDWSPRDLSPRTQDALWRILRATGRGLARRSPVGIVAARSDGGDTFVVREPSSPGASSVTVTGLPAEVSLFVHGRKQPALVDLTGPDPAVATLGAAPLGL